MKNFIFVIHKEKIYAYVLSICTIVTLFFMSNFINNNFEDSEVTSSNVVDNSIVVNDENQVDNIIE